MPFEHNYRALAPDGDVGLTRMGLKQAFEVLMKCREEPSKHVKQAIGIFAVHFSEAARIQGVLNTLCLSFSDPNFSGCQLGNSWYENNCF